MSPRRRTPSRPVRANPPRPSPYRRPTHTPAGPAPLTSPPAPSQLDHQKHADNPVEEKQGARDLSNIDPRLWSGTAMTTGLIGSNSAAGSSGRNQASGKERSLVTEATTLAGDSKGKIRAVAKQTPISRTKDSVSSDTAIDAGSDSDGGMSLRRPSTRKRARRMIEREDEEEAVAEKDKKPIAKVDQEKETDTASNDDSDSPPIRQVASRAERSRVTARVSTRRKVRAAVRTPSKLYSARLRTDLPSPIESFSPTDSPSSEPLQRKEQREVLDMTLDPSDPSDNGEFELVHDKNSEYDLDGLIDDGEIAEVGSDVDHAAGLQSDMEVRSDAGSIKTDCSGANAAIERAERILATRTNRTKSRRAQTSDDEDSDALANERPLRASKSGARKKIMDRKNRRITRASSRIDSETSTVQSGGDANDDDDDARYSGSADGGEHEGHGDGEDDRGDDPDDNAGEPDESSSSENEDEFDLDAEMPELPSLDPLVARDIIYTEYGLRPGVEITRRHREKLERKVNFERMIIMLVVRSRNGIEKSRTVLDKILYQKGFKQHWDEIMYRTRWAAERLQRVSWSQGDTNFDTVYKQFTEYHIDPFSLGEDCTGCLRYHEICWSYSDTSESNNNWHPRYTLGTDCFKSWLEARELYHLAKVVVYFRFCEFEQDSFIWKRMKPKLRKLISQTPVNIDKIVRLFDKTGMSKKFMLHFDRKIRTAQRRRAEIFDKDFIQPG